MLFLSGNTKHSFESSSSQGERLIVSLKSSFKKNLVLPANSRLKELLFHILIDSKSASSAKAASLIKHLLNEVLTEDHFDVSLFHSKAKDDRVVRAIEIMDSNLDWDISAVAKAV